MVAATTVDAVNDMTARWARDAVGERGTVLTAAGVWPLLALLAGPAGGPARAELAGALGLDAADAVRAGRDLLGALDSADGVDAALGLWTRRALSLRPEWPASLPLDAHGELTGDTTADQEALNAWAKRHTDGLIDRMPVEVDADTLLVLASALLVRTTWVRPFDEHPHEVPEGPWAGRELTLLRRYGGTAPEQVRVHRTRAGPLTSVEVEGDNGLDVHLLLGPPEMPGGEVVGHGVAALCGGYPTVCGAALTDGAGPGLQVATVPSWDGVPVVSLSCARFTVEAEHDLLRRAGLFGLGAASDTSRGHFPGISQVPLAVTSARQKATATFGPKGFRAAAVTAVAVGMGSAPSTPPHTAQWVSARFDRPFGFLAVHRATGMVLVAGWVTEPDAAEPRTGYPW
ncbi:serpin family protein [Streptomyces sp. NPDC091266]|uniref:serpin family protein n=1 Tax=Streptomyces sp. NPDC091266 TaxID=3365978 RepID=UPI0037F4A903